MNALKCIMCYIRGTIDHDIHIHLSTTICMIAYSDAEWVGVTSLFVRTISIMFFLVIILYHDPQSDMQFSLGLVLTSSTKALPMSWRGHVSFNISFKSFTVLYQRPLLSTAIMLEKFTYWPIPINIGLQNTKRLTFILCGIWSPPDIFSICPFRSSVCWYLHQGTHILSIFCFSVQFKCSSSYSPSNCKAILVYIIILCSMLCSPYF